MLLVLLITKKSENNNSQLILSSISVGTAFIIFVGILLFHSGRVMLPFSQTSPLVSTFVRTTSVHHNTTAGDNELHIVPTSSEIDVDLRESLLEVTESRQLPTRKTISEILHSV